MRGLTDRDRELIEQNMGECDSVHLPSDDDSWPIAKSEQCMRLVSEGRFTHEECPNTPGIMHYNVTAAGLEALRIDALLRSALPRP